jgi:23S rRNA pseudouridine1911/1915/1917 synthase
MSDDKYPNLFVKVLSEHLNQKNSERLDKSLVRIWPNWSRSQIQQAIRSSAVKVNEKPESDPSFKVKENDNIEVDPQYLENDQNSSLTLEARPLELQIVFEDEELIVINKEAGIVVHPGAGNEKNTLVHGVIAHCGENLPSDDQKERPGIVHRLDKGTTGLIVVAKKRLSYESLKEQFQKRSIKRSYEAIVRGSLHPEKGVFDQAIKRHPRYRKKMSVSDTGKAAVTHWEVLERFSWATLINARLETGRTHQIRVHFGAFGYPLIGDPVYGRKKKPPRGLRGKAASLWDAFGRPALHARSLGFYHPKKKQHLFFEVEPPEDFADLLNALREEASSLP